MPTNPKLILTRTQTGVVTLTINRPDARNALDWETQNLFLEHIRVLSEDASVRVLVITGTGDKAFCAGGDLVELAKYPHEADGAYLASVMGEALTRLENAPFPSLAALNGHALGGGSELAVACDLRLMAETAKIGFVQASMGLTPGWGAGQRLARVVGYSQAMYLLLTAQPIPAESALNMGLVNQVLPTHGFHQAILTLAEQIAQWDGEVVKAIKRVLRYHLTLEAKAAQAAEQAEFPPLWAAPAHLEAVEAFLNRKRA